VFPAGKLRVEALARAVAVTALWDTCHPDAARRVAFDFVNWIDLKAPSSVPAAKVLELKLAILNGVGIPVAAPPPGSPGDFGAGVFDPAKTTKTLIKTKSGKALVQLDPGSFTELTFITLSRKADNFQLHDFDGRQFPPKYDYDAVNTSGNKVLKNGKKAIVAFCLLGLDDVAFPHGYPDHPRIGHNPVAGAPGFPFEILDEVNLAAEGLDDDLSPSVCGYQPSPIGSFGGGPMGFAKAALRAAGEYLGPILLPQSLAATMLGTLPPPPPIGGRAPSLSPFGVVEESSNQVENFGGNVGAEGAGPFYVGQPLDTCRDGCGPRFAITDGESTIDTPTELTVTLLPAEGSIGELSGTTTKTTSAADFYRVEFDDLRISAPGFYQLVVSAPGASPYTSGSFEVLPNELEFNFNGDPVGQTFDENSPLTWKVCVKGCSDPLYPAVLVAGDGTPVPGIEVTVTLVPVGEPGEFGAGSTTTATTNSYGVAIFDDLNIAAQGTFQLEFSAPGTVGNITSGEFTVSAYSLHFTEDGDPTGVAGFAQNQELIWCDGTCLPTVRLQDADEHPVGGVDVTVTLVPVNESTGSFLEGSTTLVTTDAGPYYTGRARFYDLRISRYGRYKLTFSAPGAGNLTSGEFDVSD
jgi:hypothetical protein